MVSQGEIQSLTSTEQLTENLDFIIDYDIKYRMGRAADADLRELPGEVGRTGDDPTLVRIQRGPSS